tara:strand:+ start:25 stop:294 length:270 start_codon:yes stop_codon:yes gene_type:complete
MSDDLDRLTRIEAKLDQLAVMMSDLARLDERADGIEVRINRHELRLDVIESQTNRLSESVAKGEGKGLLIERAAWILFAAVVSSISHFF